MKAIFIRLFFVLITLGACTLAMAYLGPWAFLLTEHAQPSSRAAALGDLDGDGDLDAFLANGKSESQFYNTIWMNQGGTQGGQPGQFSGSGQKLGFFEYNGVALGDLDGDGDVDGLVSSVVGLHLFLNNGARQGGAVGTFKEYNRLAAGEYWDGSHPTALGDLNGDGFLDIFAGSGSGVHVFYDDNRQEWFPAFNSVWLNNRQGDFTDSGQRLGKESSEGVALGDLDSDGDLDAFVASSLADETGGQTVRDQADTIWLNDGNGNFTDSGQRLGEDVGQSLALGDLDDDGDLDAFVGSEGPDFVWVNDGAGRFTDSGQRLGQARNRVVFLGDLDGDRKLDVLVVNQKEAELWLNDGRGTFSRSSQRLQFSQRHALALGDLDGDGDLDVFAGWLDRDYRVWLNDGAGQYKLLD